MQELARTRQGCLPASKRAGNVSPKEITPRRGSTARGEIFPDLLHPTRAGLVDRRPAGRNPEICPARARACISGSLRELGWHPQGQSQCDAIYSSIV
ncbi:hypothetical protein PtA15_9A189 [Puccinia triticina]|uniref:Uncharacterized protein n=1 Tax=Puccinia triticina TaxID=208348 RepID=A0ABY7CS29_9BASI|nr:uncharacterized protein PtA15_9A189 [Puccinia triticina]WAQ88064.1 hypothetical protein PtA15_9A189 [Puccinia triticina]